jgi:cellulose synthase (UDP-forming)
VTPPLGQAVRLTFGGGLLAAAGYLVGGMVRAPHGAARADLLAALPALLLVVLLSICVRRRRYDDPATRRLLSWVQLVIVVRYLVWRALATLPSPAWTPGALGAYGFLAAELFAGWLEYYMGGRNLIHRSSRSAQADRRPAWYGARPPRVAVLIPTYNETEEILHRTVVGASSLVYPNYDVWVLDDGNRDWLRELCGRLKVGYLRRATNTGYKSGNLNAAIAHLCRGQAPPEFVAVFDADFVPRKTFLRRVMPLLHDPRVGLAQTPQFFFNPDPFQQTFKSRDVWPDDMRPYLEGVLPSLDAAGHASCVGTSFVARCSALKAIGGFATESVADDTLTSIKLRDAGFQTVYLDECLSAGVTTEGLREYLSQRARWCLGNLQIAFGPWGAARRLRGWRRALAVATEFGRPALVLVDWLWYVLPALFFWTGYSLIDADARSALSYMAPLFVFRFAVAWLSNGATLPIVEDATRLVSDFAVIPGFIKGVRERSIRAFPVTEKGRLRRRHTAHWRLLLPILSLMALTGLGLFFGLVHHSPFRGRDPGDSRLWIDAVALQKLLVLYVAASVCFERPRHRKHERFSAARPVVLTAGGLSSSGHLEDLSETGCRAALTPAPSPGVEGIVEIGGVGRYSAAVVRIARSGAIGLALRPTAEERADLIRALYCTDDFFVPARSWSFAKAMRPILLSLCGRA